MRGSRDIYLGSYFSEEIKQRQVCFSVLNTEGRSSEMGAVKEKVRKGAGSKGSKQRAGTDMKGTSFTRTSLNA